MDTYDLKEGASYRIGGDIDGRYRLWRYESDAEAYVYFGQYQKFDFESFHEYLERVESDIKRDDEACADNYYYHTHPR